MNYKIKYQENGKIKYKTIKNIDSLESTSNIIEIKKNSFNIKTIAIDSNIKKEIFNMFKQLSIMLNANLSFFESIELLLKVNQHNKVKEILESIKDSIKSSNPIDETLKKFNPYINNISILFLKLGLENGNIKEAINSLVVILEQNNQSRTKLFETLRYPFILLISLSIAIFMIFIYVIPNFEFILSSLDGEISFSTKVLLTLKTIITDFYYIMILVLIGMFFLFFYIYKNNKLFFDKLILNIPVFSNLLKAYYFYRLFLLISIIVRSKYQFQVAILNSKDIIDNEYVKKSIKDILSNIKNGKNISKSFEETNLFDQLTIRLLFTAENSNSYEKILEDISAYYKEKFKNNLKNFTSFIEPIVILLISLLVLWLVFAIMLPIWDMGSVLSH